MKMMTIAAAALCGLLFVTGCEKEQTPAEKVQAGAQQAVQETKKAADAAAKDAAKTADAVKTEAKKAAEAPKAK
ncbi:MAG: hypothetical protein ACI4RA_10695 [Kiritimatiellia bacterium]